MNGTIRGGGYIQLEILNIIKWFSNHILHNISNIDAGNTEEEGSPIKLDSYADSSVAQGHKFQFQISLTTWVKQSLMIRSMQLLPMNVNIWEKPNL